MTTGVRERLQRLIQDLEVWENLSAAATQGTYAGASTQLDMHLLHLQEEEPAASTTPAGAAQLPAAEGEVSSVSLGLSDLTRTENSDVEDPTPGVVHGGSSAHQQAACRATSRPTQTLSLSPMPQHECVCHAWL